MRYLHIIPIGLASAQRERLRREAAAHHALEQIRAHKKTRKQADDGKRVGSSSRRGAWDAAPRAAYHSMFKKHRNGRTDSTTAPKKKRTRTDTD